MLFSSQPFYFTIKWKTSQITSTTTCMTTHAIICNCSKQKQHFAKHLQHTNRHKAAISSVQYTN